MMTKAHSPSHAKSMADDLRVFEDLKLLQYPETGFADYLEGQEVELDPVAGDKIVGKLTDDEIAEYLNVIGIEERMIDLIKTIQNEANLHVASQIVEHGGDITDEFANALGKNDPSKGYAEEYFMLHTLLSFKKNEFWWKLRVRLQTFATRLSLRAGYNVVTTGLKYE